MKTRLLCYKSTGVFLRALWIILLVEAVNEFVVAALLHQLGLTFGSFAIHLVKTVIVLIVGLPILMVYVFYDHRQLLHERRVSAQVQDDYYQLFDANPDGVCLMTVSGRFIHANKAFLNFVGHDIQTLKELPSHPFLTAKNKDRILNKFELAKSGETVQFQADLTDKDGLEHPLEVVYVPKFDAGEVRSIYIVLRDVSEVVSAANQLEEMRKYLDSLIDNTSDAVIIFKKNTEIIRVNQAFTTMFGWTAEEILGKSMPGEMFGDKCEEERQLIGQVFKGQVVAGIEARRYTKSGRVIDTNLTVSPIKNEAGDIIAAAGTSRDVSAQKRIVRELQHTTRVLNSLFRYAADAITITDARGRITSVNPAWIRLFDWRMEEVKGKQLATAVQGDMLDEVLRGNTWISQEQLVRRRDGRGFYVSVTGSAMYDEETGRITGAILIYRDLTEKKHVEASLLRSEKLAVVGELAAGIAHEIRNPLTAIKGFLQMMRDSRGPQHLDILLSEVERISDITNELLFLAKPQAASVQRENAASILDEVVAFMRTQANLFSISIEPTYLPGDEDLECVRNQVKQVLINLIKNAIEAMPKGGTVYVGLSASDDEIRFVIEDTGSGIPQEKIQSLGQPFYTTKKRGTGLGLTVSYRIVENHHGTIAVSSSVGNGTRFEVVLPRTAVPSEALNYNNAKKYAL
ncbi:PAS domain-containing sensor histidine kinase [Alicyclobacillus sp. SO9]|uniref:PAS domain-containing sensor histidine kinase n=1 Tax=Alicyclobacillus sp. SO9 TaxID=2665646 RepID=UPI0018E74F3E|nr:PAS domain-containing sensor histidine kinase [Alicyclobacillus sp. SO9]QQE79971.1 PAS domain S-box protein [Alicyclobacillus sp. SO9]